MERENRSDQEYRSSGDTEVCSGQDLWSLYHY